MKLDQSNQTIYYILIVKIFPIPVYNETFFQHPYQANDPSVTYRQMIRISQVLIFHQSSYPHVIKVNYYYVVVQLEQRC